MCVYLHRDMTLYLLHRNYTADQVILSNSILIGMKQYIGFYYLILFSAQAILGERLVRV